MVCVHIKPCKGERNDTYRNLIILSKEVSELVGATNPVKIGKLLKDLQLTEEMKDKINKLRKHRELEEIQFEDYIGTKSNLSRGGRRVMGNYHARCGAGEKPEVETPEAYLSLFSLPDDFDKILSVMRSREVSVSIILQNLAQLKALFEKQWESIMGNCDEFLYLGGNEQGTHKYVSELLGKATIDTNTYGKSTGHSGNYSTNYQNTGRELMTPDEVRMLDNRYAILFIRGERPILDEKFDILKHPNVGFTTDGNGKPYLHGAVDRAVASISLGDSLEGELTDDALESEDYELLSDEDLEEIIQKYV